MEDLGINVRKILKLVSEVGCDRRGI